MDVITISKSFRRGKTFEVYLICNKNIDPLNILTVLAAVDERQYEFMRFFFPVLPQMLSV